MVVSDSSQKVSGTTWKRFNFFRCEWADDCPMLDLSLQHLFQSFLCQPAASWLLQGRLHLCPAWLGQTERVEQAVGHPGACLLIYIAASFPPP
jgi:hypothetical protein